MPDETDTKPAEDQETQNDESQVEVSDTDEVEEVSDQSENVDSDDKDSADPEAEENEEAVVAGVEAVGKVALFLHHIKKFALKIWENKTYRYRAIGGLVAFWILLLIIPFTRYGVFNTVGFRANAQVSVIDQASNLPLRNVKVELGGTSAETNDLGIAELSSVKLGSTELVVDKIAYGEVRERVTVGFGSNDMGSRTLQPIGTSFKFQINDWLSGQPIESGTATYGESSVLSDQAGLAILTIPPTDDENITIKLAAENYAEQDVEIVTTSTGTTAISLVSSQKNYFISKASGKFDVYSINLDGTDKQLLVEGTGNERSDINFSVDPSNQVGILISTRNNIKREDSNFVLDEMHLIDFSDNSLKQVTTSERIEVIGWVKDHLIYVETKNGESTHSVNRNRLVSYNFKTGESKDLQSSNYFTDVALIGEKIYYAPGLSFKQTEPKEALYSINYDGSDREVVLDKRVTSIFRKDLNILTLSAYDQQSEFFEYNLANNEVTEISSAGRNDNFFYAVNGEGNKQATVKTRDGQGVLVISEDGGEERTLVSKVGAKLPLRFVGDNLIIFRVSDNEGTSDYVVNIDGGEAEVITNVTDVAGNDVWYYYR